MTESQEQPATGTSDAPGHNGQDDLSALKQDLARLRADLTTLFHDVTDLGRSKAGAAKQKVDAGVEQLRHRLRDVGEQGQKAATGAKETLEKHPVGTLLLAFSAGVLVGKLLDRR